MNTKRLLSLRVGLLLGLLALVAATTMAVNQPSAQGATGVKKEAVLQFSIAITGDPDFDLLRIAGIADAVRKGANIGSSGQDGFAADSFFDITYRQSGEPAADGTTTQVVDVEVHAVPNNPDMNPGKVIDNVAQALIGKGHELKGHVTLIK